MAPESVEVTAISLFMIGEEKKARTGQKSKVVKRSGAV
jgi:hypothetical protein